MQQRLVDRHPEVPADQLIAQMVPPPTFDEVSFASYIPDPKEPSQAAAVRAAEDFAARVGKIHAAAGKKSLFGKKKRVDGAGLYLDGGFGVGKTHLLASIFHASPGPKSFGTFGEVTNLVGALGFTNAVERLGGNSVLCIDEFELDDPGDTMLVSRLLTELTARGVSVAATSNTLPDQLGEGRFAAQDFLREIRKLGSLFDTVRVDGPDYRHRDLPPAPEPTDPALLSEKAAATTNSTLDDFDALLTHLSTLHPSKYGSLIAGVSAVYISAVHTITDQAVALRMVVLADRLYDAGTPVTVSGAPLDKIFSEEMLGGGYRKKYLRAISRLLALSRFEVPAG
ncbi:ATPase [Nocardia sp. 852002-20019_SCH5090214]|uniref:Cell division protein ZapE n=1 Tax=Nocardia nova TaxID=37330 RepID=A0A2S5ZYA6_9NOCA|nr:MULTISPECIES: cell division protein ZapE [Nocardia]OBF80358.1 ATPase [Mycobacterium sp. 852002-51759_SCH5129042]MBF6277404.1 cell division protein ZapE [Nocardia nova]MBV7707155.1 cell division protein ZapE [Nocardia nova]OBA50607.1 ATPase [Nocardia sp. 852002-51101_SCH5132738]OBA51458.1 ATPase [Nocardia sp. 852002-20019_SCH5090214]